MNDSIRARSRTTADGRTDAAATAALRDALEALRARYDRRYLDTDPIAFPHRFERPSDRELVAFVSASLAYGNVTTIAASLERVVSWLGPRPAERAAELARAPREALGELRGFRHRWTRAKDVACLVVFAGQMMERRGSIGAFFEESYVEGDMERSLLGFSRRALALDHRGLYRSRSLPEAAGVRFFFTSPRTGACKRLNMFLRWMVRPDDGVDLGLWRFMPKSALVMPLDTHIFRIGRHLGWTARRTPGWRAAVEITSVLARIAPEDPTRYDFALSRMGILANCPRHAPEGCELCEVKRRLSRRARTARGSSRAPRRTP